MTDTEYKKAVSASLYSTGNSFRLRKALEKDKVSLAFAGGSITRGWDGTRHLEAGYSDYITDYFRKKYTDKTFEKANLSTESANSFIGLSITDKVIDDVKPDIVFLEYSVNNECGHDHIVSFESLVKRMMSLPTKPAVILVFVINRSLYSSQGYMKRIGSHYGLMSVSAGDSLKNMLDNGFDWSIYSDDVIHPNKWGHRFIADCIEHGIEKCLENNTDEPFETSEALYSLDYADYSACPSVDDTIKKTGFEPLECPEYGEYFRSGVRLVNGSRNAEITFEGEFRTLFAAYVHDRTERFSDADIIIDGEKKGVLQGRSIYGWGNVVLKNVFSFENRGKHLVQLKVKDPKKEFILIEFGMS